MKINILSQYPLVLYLLTQTAVIYFFRQLNYIFTIIAILSYLSLYFTKPGYYQQPQQTQTNNANNIKSNNNEDEKLQTTHKIRKKALNSSLILSKKRLQAKSLEEIEPSELQIQQQTDEPSPNCPDPHEPTTNFVFFEHPQCVHCMSESALRSKHCNICNRCILTYSHHSLLTGSCVGEKNRIQYMIFLFAHLAQIVALTFLTQNLLVWLLVIQCALNAFMVLYEFYLIATNQTRYEQTHKLTILNYDDNVKHPFSHGLCMNLKMYLMSSSKKEMHVWNI